MAIFPDKPWLDGYIGAKDDGSGGDNWRYWDMQKLQSSHHYQQINTQLFTGRMPFLSPNQQRQNWREIFSRVEEEFFFFKYVGDRVKLLTCSLSVLTAIFQVNLG